MAVEIGTLDELIAFSKGEYGRGTSDEYLDVKLTKDLDFADYSEQYYSWAGCTGTWYCNFNGQGHKIDNIYYMDKDDWGFFYNIYGSVQNLKLTNMYVTTTTGIIAAVCRYNSGSSLIKNCHVSGHIESLSSEVHGISGASRAANTTRECSFSGTLKGAIVIGIGTHKENGIQGIYNCSVRGTIICTSNTQYCCPWGSQNVRIVNCNFVGVAQTVSGLRWHGNWASNVSNSYIVSKPGSTGDVPSYGGINNCYYDSDQAAAAGIVFNSGIAATTEQLQSDVWMRSVGLAI